MKVHDFLMFLHSLYEIIRKSRIKRSMYEIITWVIKKTSSTFLSSLYFFL